MDIAQQLRQAVGFHQRGNLPEAERLYRQVLAAAPSSFDALHLLGVLRAQQGQSGEALDLIANALEIRPDSAEALSSHGNVLKKLDRFEDALTQYEKALAVSPGNAGALYNRGNVLEVLGRFDEALASYDRALALRPGDAEVLNNRGNILLHLGRLEEALSCYDEILAAKPHSGSALGNRGNTLRMLKRFAPALDSFDRALAINPRDAQTWSNRACTLWDMKRTAEALASFDTALAIAPDHAGALYHRGKMLWAENGNHEAAIRDLERAVAIDPELDYAGCDLLYLKLHAGDWRGYDENVALIDAGVRAGRRSAQPFIYQALSDSPADLQRCSVNYTREWYPPSPAIWKGGKRAGGKIRVGYVSGEFRAQATAYLTAGLYEQHDKSRFEIVAFDNGRADNSPVRKRLEAAFDKFVAVADLPAKAAAEQIHTEGIDILVNLNGYFGLPRMDIFAMRPAPVQVNYLGFPATLGASYIDYVLADRFVIPCSERQFYSEKVVWLPGTYQVNDSRRPIAPINPSRAENGLPAAAFVFCNFNQSYKLTPPMFAVWMRILKQVPGSVLWLLESNPAFPGNLRHEAERLGVAADRLIFAPNLPADEHLARLRLADLFLDSLPYNAHTTASDALWAGLPLLTCRGNSFAGRVATSLLHAIGLPELVTENLQDYEALALKLAGDPGLLNGLRRKLERNRLQAPLFDTSRFRRHIEAAYERMWDMAMREEAPGSFAIEA